MLATARGRQIERSKSAHRGAKPRVRFSGTKPAQPAPGARGSHPWDTMFSSTMLELKGATQFPPATPLGLLLSRKPAFIKAELRLSYPRTEALATAPWHAWGW